MPVINRIVIAIYLLSNPDYWQGLCSDCKEIEKLISLINTSTALILKNCVLIL